MDSNFFAIISRMKYIARWSLMHSLETENVMEHTCQVTIIAHALAVIKNKMYGGNVDLLKVMMYSLYHETGEVSTGDLPTPVKYYNDDIKKAYKALEKVSCEKIANTLPEELIDEFLPYILADENDEEYVIMKSADKISAYLKCLTELKLGNNEFKKAKNTIEKEIKSKKLPEVEYFMKKFVPAFEKTLDELDY